MARHDPHSFADLTQGRVTHASFSWEIDFDARAILGAVTLTFAEPVVGTIDLDTRSLTIQRVTDGHGASLPWTLHEPDPVLGARLEVSVPAPVETMTIDYATSPDASALQWLTPAQTEGGDHPYLFSQCQPHHARAMAPLQDTPAARFTFEAAVEVPEPLVAVMAAAHLGADDPADGAAIWRFEMPQAIPSYLLALAVGAIESTSLGPRSTVYAERPMLERAAWEFDHVDDMLATAEELFGPYPWDRFDLLVMPPSFPYGGMENPRLTFLTPTIVSGDRSMVNVVAHELAHSWTGNLVTNATMNDFWLNEGFTVYAERRILEALEGRESAEIAAAIGRQHLQTDLDRFGPGSPMTRLETDLAGIDPDDVYSSVPYEKGYLFVRALEEALGRPTMDALLMRYIETFRFQSISTGQLEAFLREQVPGLDERMDLEEWLRGVDLPRTAPRAEAPALAAVEELAAAWSSGARPDAETTATWTPQLWQVYLQAMPPTLSLDDCALMEERFGLSEVKNNEVLVSWLVIAARSGFEPVLPAVRRILETVGRMKYVKPLFAALMSQEATVPLAREVFEAMADRYHPIARGLLAQMVG